MCDFDQWSSIHLSIGTKTPVEVHCCTMDFTSTFHALFGLDSWVLALSTWVDWNPFPGTLSSLAHFNVLADTVEGRDKHGNNDSKSYNKSQTTRSYMGIVTIMSFLYSNRELMLALHIGGLTAISVYTELLLHRAPIHPYAAHLIPAPRHTQIFCR